MNKYKNIPNNLIYLVGNTPMVEIIYKYKGKERSVL